jgi:predicted LPLAT superfamily acyltransferase
VVDSSGAPYPVYDVLAAVAPAAGAELLDVTLRDPLAVEALALRRGAEAVVVLANLTPQPRACAVALPSGQSRSLELGPYGIARIGGP